MMAVAGRGKGARKQSITFKQPIVLTPSYSAVTLYDARGQRIGTVDPVTRVRTLVKPTKSEVEPQKSESEPEPEVPRGLRLRQDVADPIKKSQRRYWESLALSAFGISAT